MAIGINWKEIWQPVWQSIWTTTGSAYDYNIMIPRWSDSAYALLYKTAHNTSDGGLPPTRWDSPRTLFFKIANNTAGAGLLPAYGDLEPTLLYKIALNTAGVGGLLPAKGEGEWNLLYKIASNTAGSSGLAPAKGEHRKTLLYKIANNLAASVDADASAQEARIIADGGIVTDIDFLSDFITDLKAGPGNCYTALVGLWLPVAIKKNGGDKVSAIYDVSPAKTGVYYDALQTIANRQQTWVDNILDGKPVIQFDAAVANGGLVTGTITANSQPGTLMWISRKDGGGSTHRSIYDISVNRWNVLYTANETDISIAAPTQINKTTDQTTWGQFTALLSGASSYIRRKGVQIGPTVNAGTGTQSGSIRLGMSTSQSLPHNGPIALWLQGVFTDEQRDYVEGLLNTTYYPSTVA
jgi:hypothetical protein